MKLDATDANEETIQILQGVHTHPLSRFLRRKLKATRNTIEADRKVRKARKTKNRAKAKAAREARRR